MLGVRVLGLFLLIGTLANLAFSQTGKPDDKPGVAKLEPKKIDLHRVGNEELLKQAQLVLDRAGASYLAQLRELATFELGYEAARKQTAALPPAKDEPDKGDPLDQARARLDLSKKRLDLVQAEKLFLDRMAASLDACTSAALAFANLLDDLKAFVVEIDLRVKDRTLPADAVPKELEREALARRKGELVTEQDQWKQKGLATRKQLEAVGKRLDDARKAVLEAEASFGQATRKHAQEQKQKAIEKGYAGRPEPELLAELAQLQEEEPGLAGAFDLALQRFRARAARASESQGHLDALKPPRPKTGAAREDTEAALESARALQTYSTRRVEALAALRVALQAVIAQGGLVEGEAAVLGEHLHKIRTVGAVLKKNDVKESLAARSKHLTEATGHTAAAVEKGKLDLAALAQQSKDARLVLGEAGKRLNDLQVARDAGLRVAEFEKSLRGKSAAEVVADFTATAQTLEEKARTLAKDRAAFLKAGELVAGLRKKREALKDPYLRLAEAESQPEKQKLLDELKKYAGLARAPRDGSSMGMAGTMTMPGMETMTMMPTPAEPRKESDKQKGKEKEADKAGPLTAQGFQQLLATRVRIVEEQREKDGLIVQALREQEKVGAVYARTLGEVRQLTLRLYTTAIDIKKRVGRGQLKSVDVPEGITQALQRDALTRLDAATASLAGTLAETRQAGQEQRPDPTVQGSDKVLKEMLGLVSQRLDLLADLKRLEQDYKRERKDLTESEAKRLEQAANERFAREDSWVESLLRIDVSPAAKGLVEVLRTYYREALGLEERQSLLVQRKQRADKVVELTRREGELLQQARTLLARNASALERQREEEMVLTRARLKPKEADDLLRAYQTKTGKQLLRPVPVAEADRPAAVRQANAVLFERLLEIEAIHRWERLLEGRLAPAGLPAEVAGYEDEIGTLVAVYNSNASRLRALGDTTERDPVFAVADSTEASPPADSEIATTRRRLFAVRRAGVLWIALRIVVVLVLAWILPRLLAGLLRRTFATDPKEPAAQTQLVMAFLQALIKVLVYVVALVVVLSQLGFDVTAILAGLGIGGLALGLAAQHSISDMLSGIIIFIERPFSIGDTVRIGKSEPAQVVGVSWRTTRLRGADGVALNIPNRQVTQEAIVNLTREGKTYDAVSFTVAASCPVAEVVGWIGAALAGCPAILPDAGSGVDVAEMTVGPGGIYLVRYAPYYHIADLSQRDEARREILGRVVAVLAEKGVIVLPAGR